MQRWRSTCYRRFGDQGVGESVVLRGWRCGFRMFCRIRWFGDWGSGVSVVNVVFVLIDGGVCECMIWILRWMWRMGIGMSCVFCGMLRVCRSLVM